MEDMCALFAQNGALTVNGQDTMMAEVLDVFCGAVGGQEGQDGMTFVAGSSGRGMILINILGHCSNFFQMVKTSNGSSGIKGD